MGKVKVKEKEFDLADKDEALILVLTELNKTLEVIRRNLR